MHPRTDQSASSESRALGACVWRTMALTAALSALAGCQPSDRAINAFLSSSDSTVSAAEYVVQPPDLLIISSAQAAEIDGEQQAVRQDGKITLRLLGEVAVAGLTPTEINRRLESLLAKYYVEPKVNVRVAGSYSKRYYVFGDNTVKVSGPFEYTGRDTLLNALALAQPNSRAWRSQIKLIRPSADKTKRQEMTIDADRMILSGKTDQNVLLQEGDILWVPPTPLAWLGMRVADVLYPMQPATQTVTQPAMARNSINSFDSNAGR